MKRALIGGIGAIALAGMTIEAGVADLGARPITKAPIAAPIPVFSWTGCYIGGNVGGKWGSLDGAVSAAQVPVFLPNGALLTFDDNNNGNNGSFIGGGQLGCQWQTGAWVFGIEGDFDAVGSSDRTFIVRNAVVGSPFVPGDAFSLSHDWQASVRARLGYAWDRWMLYATGGIAWANLNADAVLVGVGAFSADKTISGWTVGGGFEYAFNNNLSLGIEYRYTKFDNENFGLGAIPFAVGSSGLLLNSDLQTSEVTARLNWRFNPWGGAY